MSGEFWQSYWRAAAEQRAEALAPFFAPDAVIRWHNTNEQFTAAEFIAASCEYPGAWRAALERTEAADGADITVARVFLASGSASFHVVSFFRLADGLIAELDEYWGDDGAAPQWRLERRLGKSIE